MKLVRRTDQIEYLVNKKFPGSKAPPPLMLSNHGGSGYNHAQHEKFLADIKSYKDELFIKTQAEVKALYDAEYDKEVGLLQRKKDLEESQRFFNKISANADFVHWSKAAHWSLDEAIALSFGKSPDIVSWGDVKTYTEVSPFAKEYAKRRDLALRALPWKKLFDPVLPSIFFNWAREIDIELPAELISEVEKRRGITRYWFDEYKKLKTAYDELKNNNVPAKADLANVEKNSDYKTNLINIQNLAINEFFNPRKSVDAKQDEVIEWIKSKGKELNIDVSNNVATSMFTIIKPIDHNPKKKRG